MLFRSALLVLGPELGYALAAEKGLAAYFIERRPDGSFAERQTPAFAALNGASARTALVPSNRSP